MKMKNLVSMAVLSAAMSATIAFALPPMTKKDVTVIDTLYYGGNQAKLQTKVVKYVDSSGVICFVTFMTVEEGTLPANVAATALSAPSISCIK